MADDPLNLARRRFWSGVGISLALRGVCFGGGEGFGSGGMNRKDAVRGGSAREARPRVGARNDECEWAASVKSLACLNEHGERG